MKTKSRSWNWPDAIFYTLCVCVSSLFLSLSLADKNFERAKVSALFVRRESLTGGASILEHLHLFKCSCSSNMPCVFNRVRLAESPPSSWQTII